MNIEELIQISYSILNGKNTTTIYNYDSCFLIVIEGEIMFNQLNELSLVLLKNSNFEIKEIECINNEMRIFVR